MSDLISRLKTEKDVIEYVNEKTEKVIADIQQYCASDNYELTKNIDKDIESFAEEYAEKYSVSDKEACKKISNEIKSMIKEKAKTNRGDYLIKILKPFETESRGKYSIKEKLDLIDESFEGKHEFAVWGRISKFEETSEGVKYTFSVENKRMKRFDKVFVLNDYYVKGKESNSRVANDLELSKEVIKDLYYPYEYYLEFDMDFHTNSSIQFEMGKYYKITLSDFGLVFNDIVKSGKTSLITSNARDIIEAAHEKAITDVKRRIEESHIFIGVGTLTFVDDVVSEDVGIVKVEGDTPEQKTDLTTDPENYLGELFDDYKCSTIKVYQVGSGNSIFLKISDNNNEQKILFLDAGHGFPNTSKAIEANLKKMRKLIIKTIDRNDTVYWIITHYHKDHCKFLLELKLSEDQKRKIRWILPKYAQEELINKRLEPYLIKSFPNVYKIKEDAGVCVYDNKKGIKVYQGIEPANTNKGQEWNEKCNAESILLQLKQTLLPADSYYRYWPDGYGKDENGNAKVFSYIVTPHHGYQGTSKKIEFHQDDINKITEASDQKTVFYISHDVYRDEDVDKCISEINVGLGRNITVKKTKDLPEPNSNLGYYQINDV